MTKRSAKLSVDKSIAEVLPDFKSEAEEAAWWDANQDYLSERLKKYGRMVGPLKVNRSAPPPTKAISIRIPIEDIERARAIAKKQGIGYQLVLKDAIRKGLQ
jgi:predicted DNA binding CopG/RHH family protein